MCSATLFGLLILFNVYAAIESFIAILHNRRPFPQNSQHALLEQSAPITYSLLRLGPDLNSLLEKYTLYISLTDEGAASILSVSPN
jgi:hypothetical protein